MSDGGWLKMKLSITKIFVAAILAVCLAKGLAVWCYYVYYMSPRLKIIDVQGIGLDNCWQYPSIVISISVLLKANDSFCLSICCL